MKKRTISVLLVIAMILLSSMTFFSCGEKSYTFGEYPQSEVTDTALISTLTEIADTLTKIESNTVWYVDVEYNNEKYRGVYSLETEENARWFKYEPIKWKILTEKDGKALLLCEMIIDSQVFYHSESDSIINGEPIYANNYEYSDIRAWLNNEFYDTAFSESEKNVIQITNIDNSVASTDSENNAYSCNDTADKVFLLSNSELSNSEYCFESNLGIRTFDGIYTGDLEDEKDYYLDSARKKLETDYAKSQYQNENINYNDALFTKPVFTTDLNIFDRIKYFFNPDSLEFIDGNSWWLRSPIYDSSYKVSQINNEGSRYIYSCNVTTINGVCPAIWITL